MLLALGLIMTTSNASRLTHNFRDSDNAPTIQLHSKSLQNSVKKDPAFIEKVKGFLSAGTSDSPRNIFLRLGIDIENIHFWQQGINEVESMSLKNGPPEPVSRLPMFMNAPTPAPVTPW